MRHLDPLGESIRKATAVSDAMRRADVMGESIRRVNTLTDTVRRLDPLGESIRKATALSDAMRRADVMGESIRRVNTLTDTVRRLDPLGESIRKAIAFSNTIDRASVLDRFRGIGMATAAAAIDVHSSAAFATVWRSLQISSFAERFLHDAAFGHELLTRLEAWQFEDVEEDQLPEGQTVLSAVEEAIQDVGVADREVNSEKIAAALSTFWAKLPAALRQRVGGFIVGLILLLIEYCMFIPLLHSQEPATQQKIREQRKLAAYAINQLGVSSTGFRITTVDHLQAYAFHRLDAPRTGELELGQTVEIVQKSRNWCEVIWLDANGSTKGGWVQTRYLRRL